jgi:HlyD family secretion protein
MSIATEIRDPLVEVPPASPVAPSPQRVTQPRGRFVAAAFILLALAAGAVAITRAWPALFSRPLSPVVKASGRIEGREVTLAAKTIQGRVKRLLVDEGQTVTTGQLLAELDAAQVEAQVAAARAILANVDAQVRQASLDIAYTARNSEASIAAADAALRSAQAHLVRANAVLVNATRAHERASALDKEGVLPKQDLDMAEMTLETSRADAAAAERDVTRAAANLALAAASADTVGLKREQLRALQESRRAAVARLDEAQANFAERLIAAPANGTIVSRTAEVGDVVSPGSPIFQLVDMTRLYVKVYIPEPDVAKLQVGDSADVFVDAFPGRRFAARISKIYDQAEFTPKNVETAEERLKLVFGVELAFVSADGVLKPGMPADCVIHWTPPGSGVNAHGS